jgi:hypothetical protein
MHSRSYAPLLGAGCALVGDLLEALKVFGASTMIGWLGSFGLLACLAGGEVSAAGGSWAGFAGTGTDASVGAGSATSLGLEAGSGEEAVAAAGGAPGTAAGAGSEVGSAAGAGSWVAPGAAAGAGSKVGSAAGAGSGAAPGAATGAGSATVGVGSVTVGSAGGAEVGSDAAAGSGAGSEAGSVAAAGEAAVYQLENKVRQPCGALLTGSVCRWYRSIAPHNVDRLHRTGEHTRTHIHTHHCS